MGSKTSLLPLLCRVLSFETSARILVLFSICCRWCWQIVVLVRRRGRRALSTRSPLSLCVYVSLSVAKKYVQSGWLVGKPKRPSPPSFRAAIYSYPPIVFAHWVGGVTCRVSCAAVGYMHAHTPQNHNTHNHHTHAAASVLRLKYNQPRRPRPPTARPAYRNHMASCSFVRELRQGPW